LNKTSNKFKNCKFYYKSYSKRNNKFKRRFKKTRGNNKS